jgi:hypothetical protein
VSGYSNYSVGSALSDSVAGIAQAVSSVVTPSTKTRTVMAVSRFGFDFPVAALKMETSRPSPANLTPRPTAEAGLDDTMVPAAIPPSTALTPTLNQPRKRDSEIAFVHSSHFD